MKRLVAFGLAVLVHALLVGALARSLAPVPDGEVHITDLSSGGRVYIASRGRSDLPVAASSGEGFVR
jgi:hypothetical protein